jgi:hypothetical protein
VKLVSVLGLLAVLTLTLASLAGAAAPSALKTFGSANSLVTVTGSKSATIVNDAGEYGGVYVQSKSLNGKSLAKVDFEFTASDTGTVAGGAPRFSMPMNDGTSTTSYAFIDVANCGGTWVSTANADCKVFFGADSYANWDAFAAAKPAYTIADAIPFIIADQAGNYSVSGIDLR